MRGITGPLSPLARLRAAIRPRWKASGGSFQRPCQSGW
jgi:hypothetical protein